MLSVLQVTPELNAGGVERTTIEMAEAISRAGGLALVASAGGRLEPDLEAAGGELIRLPLHSKNPITVFRNARRLEKLARRRQVQIIHARSRAPGWSALIAARRLKLPFVTTYHGIYNAKSPLKKFYNSVMARGDLVIANSEYTRGVVLKEYKLDPNKVIAIPRGVDVEHFDRDAIDPQKIASMRSGWGLKPIDARFVIVLPARLTRWKGQIVLIDAAKKVEAKLPGSLKIILAGDAQGRKAYIRELEERIADAGLRDTVFIAGHLRHIAIALAASDVAVFPSTDPEAFGRGAIEAQAMRVPVIAANHGGLSETIIDGETGLLVAPSDVDALAGAIERMMAMGPEGRAAMGKRGSGHVRQRYGKDALQTATLQVYDRLLGVSG